MSNPKAMVSWSGGKDCYLALQRVKAQLDVVGLFTLMTEDGTRSRSHGIRPEILRRQASILNLPHFSANASWREYESVFRRLLLGIRDLGVTHVIFGDIFPDENRLWAERISRSAGLQAVEPIFGECTRALAHEFIATGAIAIITTVRSSYLDRSFLGQRFTADVLERLEEKGIDPCGERGEFHTLVTQLDRSGGAIPVRCGVLHEEGGCVAIDLECPGEGGDSEVFAEYTGPYDVSR